MKVVLKPGETVDVEFHYTDGKITVVFTEADISVKADLPDSHGRGGPGHYYIYHEEFNRVKEAK